MCSFFASVNILSGFWKLVQQPLWYVYVYSHAVKTKRLSTICCFSGKLAAWSLAGLVLSSSRFSFSAFTYWSKYQQFKFSDFENFQIMKNYDCKNFVKNIVSWNNLLIGERSRSAANSHATILLSSHQFRPWSHFSNRKSWVEKNEPSGYDDTIGKLELSTTLYSSWNCNLEEELITEIQKIFSLALQPIFSNLFLPVLSQCHSKFVLTLTSFVPEGPLTLLILPVAQYSVAR